MERDNKECATCSYGKEEYERRMCFCENDMDTFCDIYCDKTGGKVSIWGYCEDINYDNPKQENHSKKKKRSKRERDIKYKSHLKYISEISNYPKPVYYTDEIWISRQGWVENPNPYYKRLYRGQRSKHLKQQSNRRIRRYKGKLPNGYYCHRLYDFWWEMC